MRNIENKNTFALEIIKNLKNQLKIYKIITAILLIINTTSLVIIFSNLK